VPFDPADIPALAFDRRSGMAASTAPPGEPRQTWRDNDGRLVAVGGVLGDACWMHWEGLATFWFDASSDVRAVPLTATRDADIRDVFVRGVLPVVLLSRGWEALHASAVLLEEHHLIAFCAVSGIGKSTLALAAAAVGGAGHFADDTVVYRRSRHEPVAVRLPSPIRVDSPVRAHFGGNEAEVARVSPGTQARLRRVYVLSRDLSLDPEHPLFSAVAPARRFETLLTHAHPFELGPESRHRAFISALLETSETIDVWQCAFHPRLEALALLAERVLTHARS
jgi:hypothetical protein